jgi:hypothetical protein
MMPTSTRTAITEQAKKINLRLFTQESFVPAEAFPLALISPHCFVYSSDRWFHVVIKDGLEIVLVSVGAGFV